MCCWEREGSWWLGAGSSPAPARSGSRGEERQKLDSLPHRMQSVSAPALPKAAMANHVLPYGQPCPALARYGMCDSARRAPSVLQGVVQRTCLGLQVALVLEHGGRRGHEGQHHFAGGLGLAGGGLGGRGRSSCAGTGIQSACKVRGHRKRRGVGCAAWQARAALRARLLPFLLTAYIGDKPHKWRVLKHLAGPRRLLTTAAA